MEVQADSFFRLRALKDLRPSDRELTFNVGSLDRCGKFFELESISFIDSVFKRLLLRDARHAQRL